MCNLNDFIHIYVSFYVEQVAGVIILIFSYGLEIKRDCAESSLWFYSLLVLSRTALPRYVILTPCFII